MKFGVSDNLVFEVFAGNFGYMKKCNLKFALKHLKTCQKKYVPRPVSEVDTFYLVVCISKKEIISCPTRVPQSVWKQFFPFLDPL